MNAEIINSPRRRGLMFVLSSPSGAGKTTLSRRMVEKNTDGSIAMSISVTTRPKRPGEREGIDYYFVSEAEFERMVAHQQLLEHATVFGHHYGTPARYVETHLHDGMDVLFDIDWQGTRALAASSRKDLVSVFILPPTMGELERRLRARAQDSDEVVKKRMEKAASEISHWEEYDYVVVNEDLDKTLENILSILKAERLKRIRQLNLPEFIKRL